MTYMKNDNKRVLRNLDDIQIWDNKNEKLISFTDLTHKERVEFIKDIPRDKLENMLLILAAEFRQCGDDLNIKAEYNNGNIIKYDTPNLK